MHNTASNLGKPVNEGILSYAPGTNERGLLEKELEKLGAGQIEIPIIIGGK